MKNILIISMLPMLFLCSCKSSAPIQNKAIDVSHTQKASQKFKLIFTDKNTIEITSKSDFQDLNLKVLHADNGDKEELLNKVISLTAGETLKTKISSVNNNTGYIHAIVRSGAKSNYVFSQSTSYKLGEQEDIEQAKKNLSIKSQQYNSN